MKAETEIEWKSGEESREKTKERVEIEVEWETREKIDKKIGVTN